MPAVGFEPITPNHIPFFLTPNSRCNFCALLLTINSFYLLLLVCVCVCVMLTVVLDSWAVVVVVVCVCVCVCVMLLLVMCDVVVGDV